MPRPRRPVVVPKPPVSRFVPAGPGIIEVVHTALRQPACTQILQIALNSFLEGRGLPLDTPINIRVTAAELTVGEAPAPPQEVEPAAAS